MAYSIIKNIQALLAALTREQYNQLMHDAVEKTPDNKTFKDIKNIRNSQTFKQVFGNKQRIWIKAEGISLADADDEARSIEAIQYETMVKDAYKTLLYINNIIIAVENEAKDNGSFSENLEKIRNHPSRNLQNNIKSWMQNIIYFYDINGKIRQQKITGFVKMLKEKHAKYIGNVFVNSISDFDVNMDAIYDSQIHKESAPADITPLLNNNDEMWICISRYPADVAAMSTDQNWTSCQNLDKNKNGKVCYDKLNWHVKYDIMFGTCVAYTISKSNIDKSRAANPNNPLFPLLHPKARILIKPWFDDNGNMYLSAGKDPVVYGNKNHFVPFINTVNYYLEQHQSNISGKFKLPNELYNESIEDEYNTLIVENGKIVDVLGHNTMIANDPYDTIEYINDNKKFFDKFFELASKENIMVIGTTINNKTLNRKHYELITYGSSIKNCICGGGTIYVALDEKDLITLSLLANNLNIIYDTKFSTNHTQSKFHINMIKLLNMKYGNKPSIIDSCKISRSSIACNGNCIINSCNIDHNDIAIYDSLLIHNKKYVSNENNYNNAKISIFANNNTFNHDVITGGKLTFYVENDRAVVFNECTLNNVKINPDSGYSDGSIIFNNCTINSKYYDGKYYLSYSNDQLIKAD